MEYENKIKQKTNVLLFTTTSDFMVTYMQLPMCQLITDVLYDIKWLKICSHTQIALMPSSLIHTKNTTEINLLEQRDEVKSEGINFLVEISRVVISSALVAKNKGP